MILQLTQQSKFKIMKTKHILQLLPLLLLMAGLAGCSMEEIPSNEESKEYNVSLKFNGEITTADQPLTRGTATDDLIGVQVYQDGEKYTHGLFDNVEDININLHSDHKYRFQVTIVKDGKNKVYSSCTNYSSSRYCYYDPFSAINLDNEFIYTNYSVLPNFEDLDKGKTYTVDKQTFDYPETDRFYGELDNYTPTANGTVAIDLKRTAFGLKYEVSGITDGTVTVKINNTSRTFFENTAITTDYQSEEKIFTFSDVYSAWLYADNYTESITVSASWARDVGITQNLGSKTVQIKRNAMNIIRIKLGSVDYDGNIGIEVEEETDMNIENVTGTLE